MRALITFAIGRHAELGEIAKPSFEEFGARHGYEVVVYDPQPHEFWPVPWLKVACLEDALANYDEALWIDADIVITDPSEDIPCRKDAWQALAVHHTQDGEVPNTGVWLCRQPMRDVLPKLWEMTGFRTHPHWEQGALCELLGYNSWDRPMSQQRVTELAKHTHFLTTEWNSHPWDESDQPRIMHATMRSHPAETMREWAGAI